MQRPLAFVLVCVLVTGCTNDQLRYSTVGQARSILDVEHKQVMDNLAAFAYNPEALPFQVNLHDGTAQITDNGSLVSQVLYVATLSIGAQRTIVDQWTMTPIVDDMPLKLLQVAYRRAFGSLEDLYTNDLANDLAHELKKQTAAVDDLRTLVQNSPNDELVKKITVPDSNDLGTEMATFTRPVREAIAREVPVIGADGKQVRAPDGKLLTRMEEHVIERHVPINQQIRVAGFNEETAFDLRARFDSVISSNDARIVQENEILTDDNLVVAPIPGRTPPLYKTATPLAAELRHKVKEVNDDLLKIMPGFVHKSQDKHEVPHDACYKGHYKNHCGESYVWVCAKDRGEFENFTLTILSLSSLIKDPNILGVSGVRYSPGTSGGAVPR